MKNYNCQRGAPCFFFYALQHKDINTQYVQFLTWDMSKFESEVEKLNILWNFQKLFWKCPGNFQKTSWRIPENSRNLHGHSGFYFPEISLSVRLWSSACTTGHGNFLRIFLQSADDNSMRRWWSPADIIEPLLSLNGFIYQFVIIQQVIICLCCHLGRDIMYFTVCAEPKSFKFRSFCYNGGETKMRKEGMKGRPFVRLLCP